MGFFKDAMAGLHREMERKAREIARDPRVTPEIRERYAEKADYIKATREKFGYR